MLSWPSGTILRQKRKALPSCEVSNLYHLVIGLDRMEEEQSIPRTIARKSFFVLVSPSRLDLI